MVSIIKYKLLLAFGKLNINSSFSIRFRIPEVYKVPIDDLIFMLEILSVVCIPVTIQVSVGVGREA